MCGKEADLRDEIVKFVEKEFQTKRTTREFYWYEHVFCHPLDVSLGCGSNFGERFMFFFFAKYVFLAKPKADSAQRIGVELLNCSLSNLFNFGYLSDFKIVSSSQKRHNKYIHKKRHNKYYQRVKKKQYIVLSC
jgi:hypothetical protein